MKPSSTSPSWPRAACATAAAVAVCFPLGMAAGFVWTHLFASFGAFLLLALLTMQFHPRSRRVAGVPVNQGRVTAS